MAKDKDPFKSLPQDFKDAVDGEMTDALKVRLSDVAKGEEANQSAKKADPDITSLKEQLKEASLGYNEVSKANKLRLKYIIKRLAQLGDPVAITIVNLDRDAEIQKDL